MAADAGSSIERLVTLINSGIRTAVVARVVRYEPGAPTATVTFLVQEDRDLPGGKQEVDAITVEGCPVLWQMGGGRALTWGLQPNDTVIALYRHRSHDEIDSGAEGPLVPASGRRMNPNDVVVWPGFSPPDVDMDSGAFRMDGQVVLSMPPGEAEHIGDSGASFTLARAGLTSAQLTTMSNAISAAVVVPGDGGASFKASLIASLAGWPGPIESDRVKVDS